MLILFHRYNPSTLLRVFNNPKLLISNKKVNLHEDATGVTDISSFSAEDAQCHQPLKAYRAVHIVEDKKPASRQLKCIL